LRGGGGNLPPTQRKWIGPTIFNMIQKHFIQEKERISKEKISDSE
jgi:hypothetical protein